MTTQETAQMLFVFRDYWPTFEIRTADGQIPGTIDSWAHALAEYQLDDVRRAVMILRGQKDRTFAPTISELEGLVREFQEERGRAERLRISFAGRPDHIESYQENGRWYTRLTRARATELAKERKAKGWIREFYELPNGRRGYRDRRV